MDEREKSVDSLFSSIILMEEEGGGDMLRVYNHKIVSEIIYIYILWLLVKCICRLHNKGEIVRYRALSFASVPSDYHLRGLVTTAATTIYRSGLPEFPFKKLSS